MQNTSKTIVVVGVIVQNNKILIGKKIKQEGHEFDEAWHIPGGKLESNESVLDGLKREMKEETNLTIEIKKPIGEWFHAHKNMRVLWFLCSVVGGEACAGDDLAEIAFVSKEDIYDRCSAQAIASWPEEFREYLKN